MFPQGLRDLLVRRRALALTLLSLVCWGTWQMTRDAGHPYGDLSRGVYTDHFSHMNAARLFTSAGLDIWRKPLRDSADPLTAEQKARLPKDLQSAAGPSGGVFAVPGWRADKPFVTSWSHLPRPHPPGDFLLTGPVALAYSYTRLSFTWANKLIILSFLIYSHIALYVLLKLGLSSDRLKPMGFLVFFLAYFEIIHWTLEGFYEAVIIVPLALCGRYLQQRRALPAIAAFTVAANIHFRSYFFLPLAIYAVWMLINERQWLRWKRSEYVLAAGSLVLGAISLGVFRIVWPWLRAMPQSNAVNITADPVNMPAVTTLVVVTGIVIAVLLFARSWMDAALAAWFCVMMMFLREALPWDVLTLLAWLALPIAGVSAKRLALVRDVRIAGLLFFGAFVFRNTTLMAPTWLDKIFT